MVKELYDFYLQNIRGSFPRDIIYMEDILVGILGKNQTSFLKDFLDISNHNFIVVMSSRALKHIHEKRPTWAFDIMTLMTRKIFLYPDYIHLNKGQKIQETFVGVRKIRDRYF